MDFSGDAQEGPSGDPRKPWLRLSAISLCWRVVRLFHITITYELYIEIHDSASFCSLVFFQFLSLTLSPTIMEVNNGCM